MLPSTSFPVIPHGKDGRRNQQSKLLYREAVESVNRLIAIAENDMHKYYQIGL